MNNREFVSTTGTLRQPENVSAAKWCRQNDIGVGTVLAGDEGHGVCLLLITAIGERQILGRAIERRGEPAGRPLEARLPRLGAGGGLVRR